MGQRTQRGSCDVKFILHFYKYDMNFPLRPLRLCAKFTTLSKADNYYLIP